MFINGMKRRLVIQLYTDSANYDINKNWKYTGC